MAGGIQNAGVRRRQRQTNPAGVGTSNMETHEGTRPFLQHVSSLAIRLASSGRGGIGVNRAIAAPGLLLLALRRRRQGWVYPQRCAAERRSRFGGLRAVGRTRPKPCTARPAAGAGESGVYNRLVAARRKWCQVIAHRLGRCRNSIGIHIKERIDVLHPGQVQAARPDCPTCRRR